VISAAVGSWSRSRGFEVVLVVGVGFVGVVETGVAQGVGAFLGA
jgi:hypothetical protein